MRHRTILVLMLLLTMSMSVLAQTQSRQKSRQLERIGRQVLTGKVLVRVSETEQSQEDYVLQTDDQRLVDLVSDQDLRSMIHRRVVVRGSLGQNHFRINSLKAIDQEPVEFKPWLGEGLNEFSFDPAKMSSSETSFVSTPPPTHYTRGVYVVRFRFEDHDVAHKQPAELQLDFFDTTYRAVSVQNFFANRIGFFQIGGSVYPQVLTIPFTKAYCEAQSRIFNECTNWIRDHVTAQGENLTGKTLGLVFPEIAGVNGPLALVGPKGDQNFSGIIWLPLSTSTMNKFVFAAAHEIGHNIGLGHSGSIGADGMVWNVDDRADFMGSKNLAGPNIYTRLMMGWFKGRLYTISGPTGPAGWSVRIDHPLSWSKRPVGVLIQLRDAAGNPSPEYRFIEWNRHQLPFNNLTNDPLYSTGMPVRKGNADMVPYTNVPFVLDCDRSTVLPNDAPCTTSLAWREEQYGLTINFYGTSLSGGMMIKVTLTQ